MLYNVVVDDIDLGGGDPGPRLCHGPQGLLLLAGLLHGSSSLGFGEIVEKPQVLQQCPGYNGHTAGGVEAPHQAHLLKVGLDRFGLLVVDRRRDDLLRSSARTGSALPHTSQMPSVLGGMPTT